MFRGQRRRPALAEQNGRGRVLLVDGGGSVRRAIVDAGVLARLATQNEWKRWLSMARVRQWTIQL